MKILYFMLAGVALDESEIGEFSFTRDSNGNVHLKLFTNGHTLDWNAGSLPELIEALKQTPYGNA